MSRAISANLLAAISQPEIQPFYAIELLFDTAPLRLWTGLGIRSINILGTAQDFTGTGQLLSISGLDEVGDLSAKGIDLTLSGIDSTVLSLALQESYQRRQCRVWFGEQSATGGSDIVQVFAGKMNVMSINDNADTGTINLSVESNLIELERSSNWRCTNDNHQSRYSGDSFFSFVQSIQDQQVAWGRTQT